MNEGWKCPECKRIYAPHVDECKACNECKAQPIVFYPYWSIYPPVWWQPCVTWQSPVITYSVTCNNATSNADSSATLDADNITGLMSSIFTEYTQRLTTTVNP